MVLPYTLAPIQVVVVPFDGEGVSKAVADIKADFLNEYIDVKVDDTDKRPGEKFFYWEILSRGIPLSV